MIFFPHTFFQNDIFSQSTVKSFSFPRFFTSSPLIFAFFFSSYFSPTNQIPKCLIVYTRGKLIFWLPYVIKKNRTEILATSSWIQVKQFLKLLFSYEYKLFILILAKWKIFFFRCNAERKEKQRQANKELKIQSSSNTTVNTWTALS